jgi:SlyX protein
MNERITYLESCIAFQDKTIDELSEIIHRQQQEIDNLQQLYQALNKKLNAIDEDQGENGASAHEKPPHY